MEKMEVQNSQPKAVATYNEEKFYAIAQKVAGDLCIPQEEIPIVKQKAMNFYLAFKQTPDADKCTPASIETAFRQAIESKLDLSKMKSQAYLIKYGSTLSFQPSYLGMIRSVYENNPDIVYGSLRAVCVYQGDDYRDKVLPNGRIVLIKHERPSLDKRTEIIVGCYAACTHKDKSTEIMFMPMAQIKKSWAKSRTGAAAAKEFPEQLAQRTVLARFAKYLSASMSDSFDFDLNDGTYIDNNTTTQVYDIPEEAPQDEVVIVDDKPQVEIVEEKTEAVAEAPVKAEDGSYVISYKEYLKVKDQVEKIAYDKESKMVTVKDKPADTLEISE